MKSYRHDAQVWFVNGVVWLVSAAISAYGMEIVEIVSCAFASFMCFAYRLKVIETGELFESGKQGK